MQLAPRHCVALLALVAGASFAHAGTTVIDYEDLTQEGTLGDPLLHMGVTYHDLNSVSGVFPTGETFGPQPDDEFVAEDAGLLYAEFPGFGSPTHGLTFGIAYIPGENLTIGPLSTVMMDLPEPVGAASLDIAFYENGPWGGIMFHLDGLHQGQVVASDTYTLSDLGGRDNPAVHHLAIAGSSIDQLHLYATYGNEYSMPRAFLDNLTLTADDPLPARATTFGRVKQLYR